MSHDKDEELNIDVIQMLLMGIQLPPGSDQSCTVLQRSKVQTWLIHVLERWQIRDVIRARVRSGLPYRQWGNTSGPDCTRGRERSGTVSE